MVSDSISRLRLSSQDCDVYKGMESSHELLIRMMTISSKRRKSVPQEFAAGEPRQKGTLKLRKELDSQLTAVSVRTSAGEFVDYPREAGAPNDNQI